MNEPACIKKLDEVVINRIAAGEVIQRPANALKEMMENSIDAKATSIQVTVKEGGLKLLQIMDNGTGIRKEDFNIVCERFTTSKLQTFEDLSSISTYGFRGEALASISHVAHLTIQSKTALQDCAYKASYIDSQIKDRPKPCAGNQGTIITVEDLFYNMSTRRKALNNALEEFRKISDVVGKYAIHNASISFALKKSGESKTLRTPANSNHVDNIRILYGDPIARELLSIEFTDDALKFSTKGHITNVNYSTKKGIIILFINHRLVDSTALKKNIDQVYSTYLPKNAYPFVYLSLEIDPKNVDVNVHPTKHEVHFLHEEQIIDKIVTELEAKLLGSNNSRVFYTQTKLPGITAEKQFSELSDDKNKPKPGYDKDLVRTDSSIQKLDKFLNVAPQNDEEMKDMNKSVINRTIVQTSTVDRNETKLLSVLSLREVVEDNCHCTLRELLQDHVFVGSIDINRSLIQHNTKLYLCNTRRIVQELFYQRILYNFNNFGTITFAQPLSLYQLALISLDLPEVGWTPEEGSKTELANQVVKILTEKAGLLNEYFNFQLDSKGNLVKIPLIIDSHTPDMAGLPQYVLRLATEVDWTKEKQCFETFAKETAIFYSNLEDSSAENSNWKWTTEHVFYPNIKKFFLPPKTFADNATILQIADLPNLYKVFERC